MLLSFPHMGNLAKGISKICQKIHIPYLIPSPPGPKALELGQALAPEASCLPFSLVLGNMREALEMGADTLIMLGGSGPCRFGYFIYLAEKILKNEGYEFQLLLIDKGKTWRSFSILRKEAGVTWPEFLRTIYFGWEAVVCEESLARLEREYLSRVKKTQNFQVFLSSCRQELDRAETLEDLKQIKDKALNYIGDADFHPPEEILRVGLVGDIYTLLEPYANHSVEELLLARGVSIAKEMSLSNWIPNALLPWRKGPYKKRLLEYAAPYLADSVGGFGLESVANTRKLGLEAVDGIIQLFPLGCMPEIVAKSALNKICLWENIPVLSITMDQHDSTTGFITRVEAFLEVLQAQKKERPLGGQTPDIRLPIMKIFFQ